MLQALSTKSHLLKSLLPFKPHHTGNQAFVPRNVRDNEHPSTAEVFAAHFQKMLRTWWWGTTAGREGKTYLITLCLHHHCHRGGLCPPSSSPLQDNGHFSTSPYASTLSCRRWVIVITFRTSCLAVEHWWGSPLDWRFVCPSVTLFIQPCLQHGPALWEKHRAHLIFAFSTCEKCEEETKALSWRAD